MLAVSLSMLLGIGCSANHRATAPPPGPPAPALHLGPVTDYVAAAGLRWMLVGSPRRIAESATFRDTLSVLLPAERVDAFAQATGVDLRRLDSALVAGGDFGTLYAFTPAPETSARIVELFRNRLLNLGRERQPHPAVQQISGIVGRTPETLIRVDQHLVAFSVGDPTLSRIVEAFARQKLHDSPTALRGAALSTLEAPPTAAVATFYAPGPFSGEWAQAARGLLGTALAISISVIPLDSSRARFVLQVTGDFPPQGADELSSAFRDLSKSSMGTLLGLDQPGELTIHERAHALTLETELALAPIARGLHAAVAADVWQIMQ